MNRTHRSPAQQLGDLIVDGRKQQGLPNQQALASALDVSQGLVSKWERGIHVPSTKHLANIIRACKLDPDQVYDLAYRATHDNNGPEAA